MRTKDHRAILAKELVDDIELQRLGAEALVLKATRLARLAGSDETRAWLQYELRGYNNAEKLSLRYMGRTGRWVNKAEQQGYWYPLAQVEATLSASTLQLEGTRLPSLSGDYLIPALRSVAHTARGLREAITTLSGIRGKVMSILHDFAADAYYEALFSGMTEEIFQQYKDEVDMLLAGQCGDVLEKLPAVYARLTEQDPEAVSQALTTVRRMIEAFADALQPPQETDWQLGGDNIKLGAKQHQNRLNYYVHQHSASNSRKKKLRQSLMNIYDRVSTGVHSEVTPEEAKSLLLASYLYFGEVVTLPRELP